MIVKRFEVDKQYDSFKSFFDFPWANQMEKKTQAFPKLEKLFIDLLMEWRQTTTTFSFPWMTMEMMKSLTDGFNTVPPRSYQWISMLREGIEPELEAIVGKPKAAQVLKLLYRNDEKALKQALGSEHSFDGQALHEQNINEPEYAMMLAGIQIQCFVFVWIAYEDFIVKLYELITDYWTTPIAKGKLKGQLPLKGYQTGGETIDHFTVAFGEPLTNECWADPEIAQIREYRHAIVHESGRVSKTREEKLKSLAIKPKANEPESLVIQNDKNEGVFHKLDDSLVIMTHQNKTAFNTLKACAEKLVEHMIANHASKIS